MDTWSWSANTTPAPMHVDYNSMAFHPSGLPEGEAPPLHYRTEILHHTMSNQLLRSTGFRAFQSRFEPTIYVHSPIKIVCSMTILQNQYPDPSVCCRKALAFFRYHYGPDKVLCATWTPVFQDQTRSADLEISLLLSIDDVQPWKKREEVLLDRNLGLDKSSVTITRVRPVDVSEKQSNIPGQFNCAIISVPQQWEREIETINMGDVLPLQSVWWRLMGYVHPFEMHSKIQGITVCGFQSHLQHTFSLAQNYISAVAVLAVHVESAADAIALANLFDGKILSGLGRAQERHLFPVHASPAEFQQFQRVRGKQPSWIIASPLLPKPPQIPSEVLAFFSIPNRPDADEEEVLVFPSTRWEGAQPRWKKQRFAAPVAETDTTFLAVRGFKTRVA